jgi:hypothetical protein
VLQRAVVAQDDVQHALLQLLGEAGQLLDAAAHAVVAERDLALQAALVGHVDRRVAGVGLQLADVVQQRARDRDVAVDPREGRADRADGLGDREAVLQQAVQVGLVVALGGGRDAVERPRLGALTEEGVQQPAQVRVLHGGEQLAEVGLHVVDAARRAVVQLGRVVGAVERRAQLQDRDLRAPALVHLVAPDDVYGRARAAELQRLGDVVPDHGRHAAGAVAEDQLEELATVAALAPVGLPDQEHLVEVGVVLKVTNEHGGKVTRPADGLWRLRTLVASSSQIVEQSRRCRASRSSLPPSASAPPAPRRRSVRMPPR